MSDEEYNEVVISAFRMPLDLTVVIHALKQNLALISRTRYSGLSTHSFKQYYKHLISEI